MLRETYDSLFARALTEELGLAVEVTNAPRFQIKLYDVRKTKPEYKSIMVCLTSNPNQVFLVKESVELE